MPAVRFQIKAIHFVPFLAVMMCAYGPCSPTSCPSDAIVGPDQGCWFEFTPRHTTVTVNAGELQVGLNSSSMSHTNPRYRFAFIQDPSEQVRSKKGRVGTWKLHIRTQRKQHNQRLRLSWSLRDSKPSLRENETLRMALSWLKQGKRLVRILPGYYNNNQHRLHAVLSSEVLSTPQTYLYPVRLKKSKGLKPHRISRKNHSVTLVAQNK